MLTPRPSYALVATLLCLAASVGADDFADFRIPDHGFLQWTGTLQGDGNWHRDAILGLSQASGRWEGAGTSLLSTLRESEAGRTELHWETTLSGRRDHERDLGRTVFPGPPGGDEDLQSWAQFADEHLLLSIDHRRYGGAGPWFVGGNASLEWLADQQWDGRHQRVDIPGPPLERMREAESVSAWDYSDLLTAGLHAGLGRVRDVTGIYDARILEDRLLRSGAITRALSHTAVQRLADFLYAHTDLEKALDRPATAAWDEVERILREDGVVPDSSLAMRSSLRAVEPYLGPMAIGGTSLLPRSSLFRQRGASVDVFVRELTQRTSARQDGAFTEQFESAGVLMVPSEHRSSSQLHATQDESFAGLEAEYHHPCGLRRQLDARASVEPVIRSRRKGLLSDLSATIADEIADRWLASAQIEYQRDLQAASSGLTDLDAWNWFGQLSLAYFVTDHVSWQFQVNEAFLSQRQDAADSSSLLVGIPMRSREGQLSLGLTYRFAGYAAAPGLFSAPGTFAR